MVLSISSGLRRCLWVAGANFSDHDLVGLISEIQVRQRLAVPSIDPTLLSTCNLER